MLVYEVFEGNKDRMVSCSIILSVQQGEVLQICLIEVVAAVNEDVSRGPLAGASCLVHLHHYRAVSALRHIVRGGGCRLSSGRLTMFCSTTSRHLTRLAVGGLCSGVPSSM